MSLSMYSASIPVLKQMLGALSGVLAKAEAHAAEKKIEPAALLGARLFPDMFPLVRQVQIAADFAKGISSRLGNIEVPSWPDDAEAGFAELQALIAKALAGDLVKDHAVFLAARKAEIPFDVCSNPEFLKEGSAIEDFTKAARIIVGTDSERARQMMRECYAPYSRNHDKLMFMDARSAELTKYAANAMLATKISFMNEIANLAERMDADIEQVRLGIGSDPRIGYHFIYPGCGYGGSCFPKDVRALAHSAGEVGYDASLIKAVELTNRRQKNVLFEKLDRIFDGDLTGRTIALWGLAFKPDTDDMREAPSRVLMEALWARGARVKAYDPAAAGMAGRLYGDRDDLVLVSRQEEAVTGADALVICTEWKQFRVVDFAWLKSQLRTPILVDGRNLYEPDDVRRHGLLYYAVGRGDSAGLFASGTGTARRLAG